MQSCVCFFTSSRFAAALLTIDDDGNWSKGTGLSGCYVVPQRIQRSTNIPDGHMPLGELMPPLSDEDAPRGRCPAWYRWQEGQVVPAVANKNFDEDKTRVHSLP